MFFWAGKRELVFQHCCSLLYQKSAERGIPPFAGTVTYFVHCEALCGVGASLMHIFILLYEYILIIHFVLQRPHVD